MARHLLLWLVSTLVGATLMACPTQDACQSDSDCEDGAVCEPAGDAKVLACFAKASRPPATPTGLTVVPEPDGTSARVEWTAGREPDLAKYNVYWGLEAATLDMSASVSARETRSLVSGLIQGSTYQFAIDAENTAGKRSARSDVVSVVIGAVDADAPSILGTQPENGSASVSIDSPFSFEFSEAVSTDSFTIRVTPEVAFEDPEWSMGGTVVTLKPRDFLAYETTYTVEVGCRDLAGNDLAGSTSLSFSTEADEVRPRIVRTTPAHMEKGVSVDAPITVTFSEPMNQQSVVTAFKLPPTVNGVLSWSSPSVLTFAPSGSMEFSKDYEVRVASTAMDLAGNALEADFSITFRTADEPDTAPPSVMGITPAQGVSGVSRNTAIKVVFSERMKKTETEAAFTVTVSDPAWVPGGSFSWNAPETELTFTPSHPFPYSATVYFQVSTGAMDSAGNRLAANLNGDFRVVRVTTATLHSTAFVDGEAWHNTLRNEYGVSSTGIDGRVGWDPVESVLLTRMFFSFDLQSLSPTPTAIKSASLYVYQTFATANAYADPPTGMGPLLVESVSYGATLYPGAFLASVNTTGSSSNLVATLPEGVGYTSTDVLTLVQNDWLRTSNGRRSQMRLKFTHDEGGFGSAGFTTAEHQTHRPYLLITYEHP
ncbi:MAG: Ig-like domain-containing protein [Myxococcaceae bacterium]